MFKRRAIKKYGNQLLPKLQKRYGQQTFYSASQVRATVYQCNFNPTYLPLGYLLFLESCTLSEIITTEFPELCMLKYKQDIRGYLDDRKYYGYLKLLNI
ncbi:DUF6559 family protein [Colwellia psychrerythraea]|uniref:Uncharacterized protein n=1 Tax=Colwellia psychrerythraea TaxID=28229 RepID=A0A099L0R2_COLPS|nr:DUF6559 family protein [Colwellia psychrerythraea]KGJ96461.1 hypothetical protein GAB14E_0408 [Colwellia psychrerythraea]